MKSIVHSSFIHKYVMLILLLLIVTVICMFVSFIQSGNSGSK